VPWLTPVIPATQEAEIRRIVVRGQPRETVFNTLSQKYLIQKRTGGVVQGGVPEFKPRYRTHKKCQQNPMSLVQGIYLLFTLHIGSGEHGRQMVPAA
jgi:hypothetical protein